MKKKTVNPADIEKRVLRIRSGVKSGDPSITLRYGIIPGPVLRYAVILPPALRYAIKPI